MLISMKRNKKSDKIFEQIVLIVSVIYPLTTLPQIFKVYTTHSAHDLSLLSWTLYGFLELLLLAYAVKYKLIPFIVQNSLWVIVDFTLVLSILIYGKR